MPNIIFPYLLNSNNAMLTRTRLDRRSYFAYILLFYFIHTFYTLAVKYIFFFTLKWLSEKNDKLTFTAEAVLMKFVAVFTDTLIASLWQVNTNVMAWTQLVTMT